MQFQVISCSYLWMHLLALCICEHIKNTTITEGSERNTSVILEETKRNVSVIEGNFMIGVILQIHDSPYVSANDSSSFDIHACGLVREYSGIQRVEAALYAIDMINRNEKLLPNITLGIDIRDGCSSTFLSAEQAVKFIEDSAHDVKYCSGNCVNNSTDTKPLIAVVGLEPNEVITDLMNMLQLYHIPLIEYSMASENGLSYIHNVIRELLLIRDVLLHYGWSYVSFVYSNDKAGQTSAYMVANMFKTHGVCVAKLHQLTRGDALNTVNIVNQLSSDEIVKVVICFCDGKSSEIFLNAISFAGLTNRFILILRDPMATRKHVLETMQDEMDGSIIIKLYATEFDPYYFTRTPANNERNPWFNEFWQHKFNCTFDTKLHPGYHICSGMEDLRMNFQQDSEVPNVIKTIYKLAHSLDKMISNVCGKNISSCSKLYPFNGTMFKDYIVQEETSFYAEYNKVARYQILNYQKLRNGMYKLVQIASWKLYDKLEILDEAKFHFGKTSISSVCSLPCGPGQRKNIEIQRAHKECCWSCISCRNNEILRNETICESCIKGFWPNENKTGCEKIKPTHLQWNDIQIIVSLSLSFIGIILTIIAVVFIIRYRDTPVVKASTKELCYFMLFGMCLAHCFPIAVVSIPSNFSCAITRLLPGTSFSIIYGSLLVMINRTDRISKKKSANLKLKFMSTTAQISICISIILVELAICALLLILEPASPELYYPTVEQVVLQCNTSYRGLILPFLFDGVLVILCSLYSVKTRHITSNFYETKFIRFCMLTTCITWVAFVLVYYGSNLEVISKCVGISVNALVILVFLFFPKLYIIIFHPEKNTTAYFCTSIDTPSLTGNSSSTHSNNSQSVRYVVKQG